MNKRRRILEPHNKDILSICLIFFCKYNGKETMQKKKKKKFLCLNEGAYFYWLFDFKNKSGKSTTIPKNEGAFFLFLSCT